MKDLNVTFENVGFNYGDFQALKGISCSLESGKIYGLIGRNGAGKTTLLSLLASYRLPTSGTIKVGVEEPFESRQIMPFINFIYETDYSEEDDTISSYFRYAKRYRPTFDMDYAKQLAAQFKLPLNKPIMKLSKGMHSALNATLGLASRSPITIFDEVYLGMDAPTRELFYQELLEDQEKYTRAVILSTHLVSEMEYLFDHVLILDQGRLIVDDSYDEVIKRGSSIIGNAPDVDEFARSMDCLSTRVLGPTKSVMIYGELSETKKVEADSRGLEIGPVSLQELFIGLTKEEFHENEK